MRVRQRIAALIAFGGAAVLLTAGLVTPADAVPQVSETAQLTHVVFLETWRTIKCASIPGNNPADLVQVIQFTCGDTTHKEQKWSATDVGTDHYGNFGYIFKNVQTGKCLTSAGGDSGPVWQYTCLPNHYNQIWSRDNAFRLHNWQSGECLAVPGGPREDVVGLIHFACSDSDSQKWAMEPTT